MIGILGGTFDPVHQGHLHIAEAVLKRLQPDEIQFMPCALPVHRGTPHASAGQRCAMIELALSGRERMSLNRIEIDRSGPSYTVDSLRELRCRTDSTLLLLLGADAFNGLLSWRDPDGILELSHIVVCIRPGVRLDPDLYADYRTDSAATLSRRSAGAVLVLEVDAPDCASREIRAALLKGDSSGRCLQAEVMEYIESERLYRRTDG